MGNIDPHFFRNVLFSVSGLSIGLAIYAMIIRILLYRRDGLKTHFGIALFLLAYVITTGEVLKTILLPLTEITPNWDAHIYGVGLTLGAIGAFIIARNTASAWKEFRKNRVGS